MKINRRAITLLEIIVSSAIFGIIMLGLITSSIALQKNSLNAANFYYLIQNTNLTLGSILMDASKMTGTPSAPGFATCDNPMNCSDDDDSVPVNIGSDYLGRDIYAPNSGDIDTFCFYQELTPYVPVDKTNSHTTNPDLNIDNTGPWACYTFVKPNIYKCTITSFPSKDGYGICDPTNIRFSTVNKPKLIGQASKVSVNFKLSGGVGTTSDNKVLFEVTIENCIDNVNDCRSGNPNKPFIIKSGSVSPPAHSA